jgi:microcystin-dependent protein
MNLMRGKITLFPYTFAPNDWMFCDGTLLQISSRNTNLFVLLGGNTFGGDGQRTFGLPDLRSITPDECHYCIAVQGQFGVTQYEGFVGETFLLPFRSEARDLLECTGQSLPRSQYPLLSRLMGTRFGGDGANFNLPDLRSTTPKGHQSMMAVQGVDPNSGSGMDDRFVGELFLMPYDTVENLLLCDGTRLGISGNEKLFNLLETRFGGDGIREFALPDLRAVAPAKYNYFMAGRGMYPVRL